MKVQNDPRSQIAPNKATEGNQVQRGTDGQKVREQGDYQVSLSGKSLERQRMQKKALEIANQTPDVREDRVAELRRQIKDGSYKIDPEKIAMGMIREAVRDQVAEMPDE